MNLKQLYRLYQILKNPEVVKAIKSRYSYLLNSDKDEPSHIVESYKEKMDNDALPRTNYAYGTYYSAIQARGLGIDKISVIEFGVAGGNGLVELENVALEVEKETHVKVDVYGFDTAEGMPEYQSYKDMPYVWQKGFFKMDAPALKARLTKAKLILGNIKNTLDDFVNMEPAPIGFISFDLDYYSSTVDALKLFQCSDKYFLPRVFCYFDDCIGDDFELHSQFCGELLAIKEFNENNTMRKIDKINGLRYKRRYRQPWNEVMYAFHIFDHPLYSKYINPKENWDQLIKLRN